MWYDCSVKISYHSHIGGLDLSQGYGVAGYGIVTALKKMGHEVPFNDPHADILLNFTQPTMYQFHNTGQYNIGYTPWESSKVDPAWVPRMNAVDEMWTTSPMVAQWFKDAGCTQDIKIFEHGIDHRWQPRRRRPHRKIRFLHVGGETSRKGGQDTFDAFIEAFGKNNPNVTLTFKTNQHHLTIRKRENSFLYNPTVYSNNIKHVSGELPLDELIALFNMHDVFVYPSYGEGFGFMPLQALASGMPTIQTVSWAPYKQFVIPDLSVRDSEIDSPWRHEHPGKVLKPNFDDLVEAFLYAYEHFAALADIVYERAPKVHMRYDWYNLTKRQFDPVIAKVNSM